MAAHLLQFKDTGKSISGRGKEVGKGTERQGNDGAPPTGQTLCRAPHPRALHACALLGYLLSMPVSICRTSTVYQVLEEQNRVRPSACSSHNYCQALKSIVQGARVENPCAINGQMGTSCTAALGTG